MDRTRPSRSWTTYCNPGSLPFWGVHVAAVVGVVALGFSWTGLLLALALYVVRMFFVTAGYHRYFSHRSFKTSRAFQLVLAVGAQTALQRGVLWWASTHRHHHAHSDGPEDVHSPARDGFWWSHLGWQLDPESNKADPERVRDLSRFPELRLLDRWGHVPGIALAVALALIGGAHAAVWGFFVSTTLLWHGTFLINSLAHVIGSRRYPTTDDSRNHWALAVATLGEGWHNNHHHYMSSARQGFRWWEIDPTYYGLRALALLRLVWDVRVPPAHVIAGEEAPRRAALAALPAVPVPLEAKLARSAA
jgi:stearoyl-CoA desaturase (Delta-9 desaturase)